jgi:hypothetical protein
MTRDEFIKKFKVGDKVTTDYWGPGIWFEILFIGSKRFFVKNNVLNEDSVYYYEYALYFDEHTLTHYTEPQKQKKTVKMARALAQNNNGRFYVSDFIYSSKEEAISFLGKLIQWPLVINNEEQWVTVEVEE